MNCNAAFNFSLTCLFAPSQNEDSETNPPWKQVALAATTLVAVGGVYYACCKRSKAAKEGAAAPQHAEASEDQPDWATKMRRMLNQVPREDQERIALVGVKSTSMCSGFGGAVPLAEKAVQLFFSLFGKKDQ